jgi:hypothetical protein
MQTVIMDTSSQNLDVIANSLDLQPIEDNKKAAQDTIVDDYEYARGNMIAVIEKGQEALSGILDVAGMSQHPRSYEVVATLVKAVADANKDLLELAKKRKDLEKVDNGGPQTVNNNLYLGSTADLLKLLKDSK